MKTNLLTYPRFLMLFLKLKLLGLKRQLPPLAGGVLDEQTAVMRKSQMVLGETFFDQGSVAEARRKFDANFPLLKSIGGIYEKVASVQDRDIPGPTGGIPCRIYLPDQKSGHALFVFLHGGGWVIGNLASADNMARYLCKHAGFVVLSVDYRLAPEHAFPAAVEDSLAAVEWALEHAPEVGADRARVLVGGDSAGGNLAAAVSQLSHPKSTLKIAGQVLFYPATDCAHLNTPSYKEFGDQPLGLPTRDMDWFLDQYAPEHQDRHDTRLSPLLAKDLSVLPPALVVTAEFDVLRDEGEAYARHMEKAGVKVKLMRCNGMVHGFLSSLGLVKRGVQYFDEIILEIQKMV